ncbi:MAG TPA: glycosyltransferase [Actinobacteria bacterium]|nr:glycosyltransferase [Actinomycetota bacterium]
MPRFTQTPKKSARSSRVDLHLHSRYSRESDLWLLRQSGIGESNTDPEEAYRIARERGMTYVTLTDHNTIDGALTLADRDDFFISEEVTTFFPGEDIKLHVLALGITERQHAEMAAIRASMYELVSYMRQEGILNILAHPLTRLGGELDPDYIERLMLLFPIWEVRNGSTLAQENQLARRLAQSCTPQILERLANKHNLEPVPRQSISFTAGSDDHSGMDIASAYTVTAATGSWQKFLEEVKTGRCSIEGAHGGTLKLAHSMLNLPSGDQEANSEKMDECGNGSESDGESTGNLLDHIPGAGNKKWLQLVSMAVGGGYNNLLKTVMSDRDLRRVFRPLLTGMFRLDRLEGDKRHDELFSIANAAWSAGMRSAITELSRFSLINLMGNLDTIGRLVALQGLLAPYALAANYHSRQSHFLRRLETRMLEPLPTAGRGHPSTEQPPRVGLFTDTYLEVNGVTSILRRLAEFSHKESLPLDIITSCGNSRSRMGKVTRFEPVASIDLADFGDLTLAVPPMPELLRYCEEQSFDIIHAATPGPMGLAALLASRVLQVPLVCSFHTDVPRCIGSLTSDKLNEEIAWTYTRWFYGHSDLTLVPSAFSSMDLAAHGLDHRKMAVLYQGVDCDRFSPAFASRRWRKRLAPAEGKKIILYVGRLSGEKDLRFLAQSYRQMAASRTDVHLALVGDGPQRTELEDLLGDSATFTGWLEGNELAAAYASADLFVFPSSVDTSGQVILEAQAAGLPVVLSSEGGARENIDPGVNGLVARRRDSAELIRQMEAILDDDQLRARMAHQARKTALGRSWERVFTDLFSTYQDLLSWWRADRDGRSLWQDKDPGDSGATAGAPLERPVFPNGRPPATVS